MPLIELLTDGSPFGPIDQSLIDNQNDAVDVLGLFGPLPTALAGDYTLVYGRKGCGKTAVISMLQGYLRSQPRLEHADIKLHDVYRNSIIIPIVSWEKFLTMNTNVSRYLRDRTRTLSTEPTELEPDLVLPEAVENAWINEIWDTIFIHVYGLIQKEDGLTRDDILDLKSVSLCFDDEAMASKRGTLEYVSHAIFMAAKESICNFLIKKAVSICILFDSLDQYPMYNSTFGLNMSGFLRAINKITKQHNRIKIVFMLPEELLKHFRASSANILKDFALSYPMRWSPIDLLRICAHRYTLFLRIHDNEYYESSFRDFDLKDRNAVNEFFNGLMPDYITNDLGIRESSRAYIIRHTQLLPRHILFIFNRIAVWSHQETHNWRQFTENAIVKGVQEVEEDIANNVLHPYETNYDDLTANLNMVLGDLPPIFKYGDIHKCVRRIKNAYRLSHHEMIELLFRIGIIGRVHERKNANDDPTLEMYTMADFYFNFQGNISFSGTDALCFHPNFSRFYGASRHRKGDLRIIYPSGISFTNDGG